MWQLLGKMLFLISGVKMRNTLLHVLPGESLNEMMFFPVKIK